MTPPASGRSTPFNGAPANPYAHGQRYADDLEGQNDEALEGLSAKVKLLKDVRESSLHSRSRELRYICLLELTCSSPGRASNLPASNGFLDHNWYWERSTRVDHPTQPNGMFVYGLLTT